MKLRIIAGGIFGANGEYAVGHEFETDAEIPAGWAGKVIIIEDEPNSDAKAVTNPKAK
jgi:hypothetical protein